MEKTLKHNLLPTYFSLRVKICTLCSDDYQKLLLSDERDPRNRLKISFLKLREFK